MSILRHIQVVIKVYACPLAASMHQSNDNWLTQNNYYRWDTINISIEVRYNACCASVADAMALILLSQTLQLTCAAVAMLLI